DRFELRTANRRAQAGDGNGHDAFVEAVRERDLIGRHTEVLGDGVGGGGVRWIESNLLGTQPPERLEDTWRTAAGVLVLVEPQPFVQSGRLLVVAHCKRTSMDSACASSPSARAS